MELARFKKDIKDKDGNIVFKANPKKSYTNCRKDEERWKML